MQGATKSVKFVAVNNNRPKEIILQQVNQLSLITFPLALSTMAIAIFFSRKSP